MTLYAACFTNQPEKFNQVFSAGRLQQLSNWCQFYPQTITEQNISARLPELAKTEVIFSSWGMFPLNESQLDALPNLKILFYAAGKTDAFASTLIKRGIIVVSAWRANAVPVAEFCLAQILLACKGYFRNQREYQTPADFTPLHYQHPAPGVYDERVALIGAGAISQTLAQLLHPFALEVITVPSRAGKRTLSLEAAFETALVVSNHLPNRNDNKHILNGDLFRRMRPGAVFINTGRGMQVNEAELITVMQQRPDLTALLDVTSPEPPAFNSPLYQLPNILLTSHIAGALNNETRRLGDLIIAEFKRWMDNEPLQHRVIF
ncbi:MAG: hydroxyacid dehydrogenase [Enterobacteriaceae bacterium]|uniref:hydroxyacid dehydrogenase n=2 Tax=Pseudomonadati TaxID=3379134 RepID=UPI00057C1081|nr:phosphoglycerate dehydrogenase [Enterobacteriaceae bacterium ENNIH3]AUV06189.1 phosphoglycerate dehydrogenase [Enterobacteriaceae bacterium ENNIH2]MBS6740022.1 hydroxyacid dehydrogenase [Enterobacteriaceae bacterium]MDU4997342.1 hydroxyacid dehydrogenase [Enterobacteriaceae bacterium]PWF52844.1 phosphoglycerate dehydrogenase [[Kluyvera] intestini]